ncbi:MAG: N-acetylmuramoyl-L-alanine amidase family protein [Halanaerobiales bacterium]
MKKKLSIFLILVVLFSISLNSKKAYALNNDGTGSNLMSIAKGVVSLILLNSAYNYIDDLTQSQKSIETNPSDNSSDIIADIKAEDKLEIEKRRNESKGQTRTGSIRSSSDLSDQIIVIDPGHGGHDPGAIGPAGLKEKDVNLDISLKLYDFLKKNTTARVYLTRDSDVFISLRERSEMANRLNPDIFISIHANADEWRKRRGIETYAHYNTSKDSWALAWYLQDSMVTALGLSDQGLKSDNFHVIRETAHVKSVLLEIGFISHPTEEIFLSNKNNRTKAAKAIYEGILDYYGGI